MKKTLLILILLPIVSFGQDLKQYIQDYEKYCNQIVLDTIEQQGHVTESFKLIDREKGYWGVKLDTTWYEPECPEFKTTRVIYWTSPTIQWHGVTTDTELIGDFVSSGGISGSERGNKKQRPISRDYVCECKRREVQPFSEHFWEWVKDQD
ncbi:MAG: hypothetical protein AB3N18_11175 [Allomuricauda sp.]